MYPFLDIFWTQIHMTWVGVICFLLVFLVVTKYQAKRSWLDRKLFWSYVPYYLLVIYFVSSYMWYAIEEFIFFPLSLRQIMLYISPYEYTFHLVWIVISVALCVSHFFGIVKDKYKQVSWVDTRFYAAMLAFFPLGIFLLLGDNFVWIPQSWGISVSTFHPESKWVAYDSVIPLWLYLSLIALVSLWCKKMRTLRYPQSTGWGFIWWSGFLFFLSILLLFQEYPRHLVVSFLGATWDIKNYVLLIAMWAMMWLYRTIYVFFVTK